MALQDLAEKSDFDSFYAAHRADFEGDLESTLDDFDAKRKIEWLEEFFGWLAGDEFHIVLVRAMFPAGGYGATIEKSDGRKEVRQISEKGEQKKRLNFQWGKDLSF